MTAISTILSILFLPANLLLYTKFSYHGEVVSSLDWTSLFIALAVVIVAITAGLFTSYHNDSVSDKRSFQHMANHMGNLAGFCLILLTVFMSNSGSENDSKIWSRHWTFYVGVASPCVGGIIVANIISTVLRLRKPERVTVSIECCYQNVSRRCRQIMCRVISDDRFLMTHTEVFTFDEMTGRYCYLFGFDDVSGPRFGTGYGGTFLLRRRRSRSDWNLRVTCMEGGMDQSVGKCTYMVSPLDVL